MPQFGSISSAVIPSPVLSATIDAAGTLTLSFDGKIVATGMIHVSDNAGAWAKIPANLGMQTIGVNQQSGVITVTQTSAAIHAMHTMAIVGDDLTVTSVVQNTGTATINVPHIGDVTFAFTKIPTGYAQNWHWTYTQANPLACWHPTNRSPLGATYLTDGVFGIGYHTASHLRANRPSLVRTQWAANNLLTANPSIGIDFNDPIWPGETKTFTSTIHFSTDTSFQGMLASYAVDYRQQIGGLKYSPDNRPYGFFASADKTWVTPADPFGFNGDERRLDTVIGAKAFTDWVVPPLIANGFGGMLLWASQGFDPRGQMYRPDFDVYPSEIQANLASIFGAFTAAKLRIGIASRPGSYADRSTIAADEIVSLQSTNTDQMASLLRRFTHMTSLGVGGSYVDSFPLLPDHQLILEFLSAKLGSNFLMFSEYATDLSVAYSGMYCSQDANGGYNIDLNLLKIYQWLQPGMSVVCKFFAASPDYGAMMKLGIMPLVQDYLIATQGPKVKAAMAVK